MGPNSTVLRVLTLVWGEGGENVKGKEFVRNHGSPVDPFLVVNMSNGRNQRELIRHKQQL